MKVQKQFVLRKIGGEYVIIPTRRTDPTVNRLIILNEIQADLWRMLQGGADFDDLLSGIMEIYDVSASSARDDIQEFLGTLEGAGMLDKSE